MNVITSTLCWKTRSDRCCDFPSIPQLIIKAGKGKVFLPKNIPESKVHLSMPPFLPWQFEAYY